jgi:hypothetical protein
MSRSPIADIRVVVASSLSVKTPEGLEVATRLYADPDIDVKAAAFRALARLQTTEALSDELKLSLRESSAAFMTSDDEQLAFVAAAFGTLLEVAAAVPAVQSFFQWSETEYRVLWFQRLAQLILDDVDRKLVSKDLDGLRPFRDPSDAIPDSAVEILAGRTGVAVDEIRERREALARRFGLAGLLPTVELA